MIRNSTVSGMAIAVPDTRPRWQLLVCGFLIALLVYLALALAPSPFHPTFDRGVIDAGEPAIMRTLSWGGTNPGHTHYALTIYHNRSLELTWGSFEAVAVGAANAGAWVNSRTGSLCLNCD